MKKLSFTLLCLMAASILLVTGCRDDEETPDPIVGTWQKSKVEKSTNGGSWTDTTAPCELDDTEEYSSNGEWTLYSGPNQCSAGTGVVRGTWRVAANRTKVVYTYDDVPGEYESTLDHLSGNELVIIHAVGDVANTQYKTTYVKQ